MSEPQVGQRVLGLTSGCWSAARRAVPTSSLRLSTWTSRTSSARHADGAGTLNSDSCRTSIRSPVWIVVTAPNAWPVPQSTTASVHRQRRRPSQDRRAPENISAQPPSLVYANGLSPGHAVSHCWAVASSRLARCSRLRRRVSWRRHHDDRARRVLDDLLTHRTQEETRETAASPRADHDQVRSFGGLEERLHG